MKYLVSSLIYFGGCGKIGRVKLFEEFGPWRYGLGSPAGVALNLGEYSKKNRTNIDFFVNWLANQSLPWAVYCEFMSGRLIALDMQTGVGPVGVGEAWICLIAKRALKATGPLATTAFQDD